MALFTHFPCKKKKRNSGNRPKKGQAETNPAMIQGENRLLPGGYNYHSALKNGKAGIAHIHCTKRLGYTLSTDRPAAGGSPLVDNSIKKVHKLTKTGITLKPFRN